MKTRENPLGRQLPCLLRTGNEDLDAWPTPDDGVLTEFDRKKYLMRKEAVRLYLAGYGDSLIREKCEIGLKQTYRLITERCLKTHPDGRIYGFRGLIPKLRIKPYKRKRKVKVNEFGGGAVGAMGLVLDLNPDLRRSFDKKILESASSSTLSLIRKPRQALWKWFLDRLRDLGYEVRGEWPFNTITNGYNSVCRYIDLAYKLNPKMAARAIGGKTLERKLITGDGVDRPVKRVLQRVEMDAHKLDGRFCVLMPNGDGEHVPRIVHRLWVIVILDVESRAVLGYHFALGKEVSKTDVLRAIKSALTRWRRRILSPGLEHIYWDDANFPSGMSDRYVGMCWDETSVDGALAETCKSVEQFLRDVVNSRLISPKEGFASRRGLDERPFIETFFRVLAGGGLHKMSNTTGSKPKDRKGREPEEVALNSQFQLEYAEDLIDVLIANYNATPHTSLGYRTPLQFLEYATNRPDFSFRYADPEQVSLLLSLRKKCKVQGGVQEGRAPYVNFENARYTNEILSQRFDLAGKYIDVINHEENDARIALASTSDGQSLGVLRAGPPWHRFPHSLRIRAAIKGMIRKKMFYVASGTDATEAFVEYCESQSNKKLPPHPSYLEFRRIIANSERNESEELLRVALDTISSSNEAEIARRDQAIGGKDSDSEVNECSQGSSPRRRKAASS